MKRFYVIFVLIVLVLTISGCAVNISKINQSPDIDEMEKVEKEDLSEKVPIEFMDDGIFSDSYEKAYEMLKNMTLEQKIGQTLLARYPAENSINAIEEYKLGGFVLFKRDFENKTADEIKKEIFDCQYESDIPLIMAVDEEGGVVVRISSNPNLAKSKFLSQRELYLSGQENIIADAKIKAEVLLGLGLNTNLAPVADVSTNESDFIYNRTIGENAQKTAEFVQLVVETAQENGLSCTLKHFPGYGNNIDTHTGIANDKRSLEELRENDFIPFISGINSEVHCILVSHNIVEAIDSSKPASLSAPMHDILRNELDFTGIIMTDDLEMDAIKLYTSENPAAVEAILAGNDMQIITDYETGFNDILNAVNENIISEEMIDHAVFRILAWKYSKGLM